MKIEKKLIIYILLIPIVGMIVGFSGSLYLLDSSIELSQKQGAIFLKQREIKLQKDRLKTLVDSAVNNIRMLDKEKRDILKCITKLYPPKKDNYIFIYKVNNLNGGKNFATMLLNVNRPSLVGKKLDDDYKDAKGFEFRRKMLELIRKNGEGFVKYYYKKPNSNKIEPKISYFKYYAPLHIIVASGVYLDDVEITIGHYKSHLKEINHKINKQLFIVDSLIGLFVFMFTVFIVMKIKDEFHKYRMTISLNEKKLRYKLYVDELTKLKSRKSLVEDIQKEKFDCLIMIDIDNFRTINQFFGANIGDKYLIEFAKLLKKFRRSVSNSLSLYRMGADEFAITVKHSDYEITYELTKKLLQFVEDNNKILIDNEVFDVDITAVFTNFPNPLKKALITLAQAKEDRISLLSYVEIKDKNKEKELFELKKILKTAIKENQITPFAQPILNADKKVIKYELLMRIVTEDKVIPPYFLEAAKKLKLYEAISHMMYEKCFEFIKTTDILCSINIDMQDILNPSTIKLLKDNITTIQKPVVFEILESESFQNFSLLKKFMNEFREYGVLFAIDDFGSGYSNYSEILELKPDYLKIDGSLIKNVTKSKENMILIDSILFLTNMLGMKTTAEFVENKEIFDKLKALGVTEYQGYYFSKPKPLSEL